MRILKQYSKDNSRNFGFDLDTNIEFDPEMPVQYRRFTLWFYWGRFTASATFRISK
tara:strand:+ start:9268 stop:9435 length:168 start_codon:yes stop_codon:yes gene_type:complete